MKDKSRKKKIVPEGGVTFVKSFLKEFSTNTASMISNGMVYSTLIAVIPCIAFIYAALNLFGVLDPVVELIENYIIQTFGETTGKNLVGYVRYFTDNAMSMGVVSILSFGVTFVLLIDKIYTMVNRFYHAGPGKIYIRYLKYVAFIVGGILAIAGMVFFVGRFNSFSAKLLNLPAIGYVGKVLRLLVPVAVIFGVMFSIIKFIPNCKVRTSSCLLGAGVGTVGIWVLGFIFQFIVRRSVKYSIIYGSLATLLFFFMFLSYLWKIVFSAVIASYVHQKIAESKAVKTE